MGKGEMKGEGEGKMTGGSECRGRERRGAAPPLQTRVPETRVELRKNI